MQFGNPTTGPFTVSGGTVDSVTGDVLGNLGGHVTGDVQGNLGGHVTGDVQGNLGGHVTGDVQGNVSGTVGSVTAPVTPDPSSTIAVVSTSVPFQNRDQWYWQAVSGEAFPPTFTTAAYSLRDNFPVWSTSGGVGTVVFPNMPRVAPSGKQNLSFKWKLKIAATTTGGVIFAYGKAGIVNSATDKGVSLSTSVPSGFVSMNVADGSTLTTYNDNLNIHDGAWHDMELDISAAGVVTLYIDGVLRLTSSAALPPTVILVAIAPRLGLPVSGNSWASQLQIGWT